MTGGSFARLQRMRHLLSQRSMRRTVQVLVVVGILLIPTPVLAVVAAHLAVNFNCLLRPGLSLELRS